MLNIYTDVILAEFYLATDNSAKVSYNWNML